VSAAPPHDLAAERAVISTCLLHPEHLAVAEAIVTADEIFAPAHRAIWQAMAAVRASGIEVDVVSVRAELDRRGQLAAVGGSAALIGLIDDVPATAHVEQHARVIHEAAVRRTLIRDLDRARADARNGAPLADLAVTIDTAARLSSGGLQTAVESYADVARRVYEQMTSPAATDRLTTGIEAIDEGLGGLWIGDTTVIGARSSFGKSSLANALVLASLEAGEKPLIVSTEDRNDRYVSRRLIEASGVPAIDFRDRQLDQAGWSAVTDAVEKATTETTPTYYYAAGESAERIAATIRARIATEGHRVVIIDYLQRIRAEKRFDKRHEQISYCMQLCTEASKRGGAACIVMSQLLKSVGRSDKPTISDLKETGDIEIFSDHVLLGWQGDDARRWLAVAKTKDGARDDEYELPWSERGAFVLRGSQHWPGKEEWNGEL